MNRPTQTPPRPVAAPITPPRPRPQKIEQKQTEDEKLNILIAQEKEAMQRMKNAAASGRIDDIPQLNEYLTKCRERIEAYKNGFGSGLVGEAKVCYCQTGSVNEVEYELASGMYTNSLVKVKLNIDLLIIKIEGGKRDFVPEYRRLAQLYNTVAEFEAYNVNYF